MEDACTGLRVDMTNGRGIGDARVRDAYDVLNMGRVAVPQVGVTSGMEAGAAAIRGRR